MFGTTMLTTLLGAPPAADAPTPVIKNYVRMLAREAGLHILLTQPGTKIPADMRNKKEKEADLEAGNRAGVYLATNETRTLDKYIGRYRKDAPARPSKVNPAGYGAECEVGLAVHLGPSRLVVIDADTPSEVAALKQYWMEAEGLPSLQHVPHMTVATPGQTDEQGNRVHSEGGHWYFTLPAGFDIDPVTTPSAITITVDGVGQFTIKSGSSYVLIPPTRREGRAYTMLAPDNEAPLWLLQLIKSRENTAAADPQAAREEREAPVRERMELLARIQGGAGEAYAFGGQPASYESAQDEAREDAEAAREELLEERAEQLDGDTLDEQLESWSLTTSWSDVLDPAGWFDSGRVDGCGCPIWTRPDHGMGAASTYKSATTHDAGCNRERTDHAHPAMHIWTDNPGDKLQHLIDETGSKTVSKFSVYAALEHGGDIQQAMKAAGVSVMSIGGGIPVSLKDLARLGGNDQTEVDLADHMMEADQAVPSVAPSPEQWKQLTPVPSVAQDVDVPSVAQDPAEFKLPYADLFPPETVLTPSGRDVFAEWGIDRPDTPDADGNVSDEWRKAVPSFGAFGLFREMPPVSWLIDGLLERGGLLSLIGPSGVGKSAVVLDMACAIAAGLGHWHQIKCDSAPVIYIAGEGISGAVERVKAWERANNMVGALDDKLYIVPESVNLASHQLTWAYISHLARGLGAGLIVMDTFARMSGGLEENSSKDMGAAVSRMDKVRRTSGAAVLVVHHTSNGTTKSRGSSAINGAMDSELLLTRTGKDDKAPVHDNTGDQVDGVALTLSISKQKNAPDDFEVELVLASEDAISPMAPYQVLEPGMVVTDVNGRPAAYRADYLQGEAPKHFAPPRPEALDVTAQRVLDFVNEFETLEVSRTAIVDGVQPDYYHDGKAKEWRTHITRVLDRLVSQGKLARDGKASFKRPDLDDEVSTVRDRIQM